MKTNFNQIGNWRMCLKSAAMVCLAGLPLVFISAIPAPVAGLAVVKLSAGVTGAEIQRALDALPTSGGEVILPEGRFEVQQPIILKRDNQTLRGAGAATVLHLADNANCPVVILGEPLNTPTQTIRHLKVADFILMEPRPSAARTLAVDRRRFGNPQQWHHGAKRQRFDGGRCDLRTLPFRGGGAL